MNKNLKKVISAVAALAISASSIAAFAVNFPDVEETASYAQAVQELSALGVISGFEDGTFKPDELVTRAQISKMIVDALAEGNQAEASSNFSKFADVSDHWATGYINQGVADGWIAGYSDTEFGPDDNVTYVQAQKMLVAATGYDIYATAQGGWPAGYKLYASSLDITKGVQGVTSDDQQLTRAQVAQMIDNAMDAPLCVIDRWEPNAWGTANNPILDVKDDKEDGGYKTLFTEKHDAYKVYGRVIETSKSGSVDTDRVKFQVEKANNYDDKYIDAKVESPKEDMYFAGTKADEMIRTYAQALVQKDDNDEFSILSIVAAAANKSVDFLAEDINDDKTNLTSEQQVLCFYNSGSTKSYQKYELAKDVRVYVNDRQIQEDGRFDAATYAKYIYGEDANGNNVANEANIVTLEKETTTASTNASSKYNVIKIKSYTTAVVDSVTEKSSEISVNFKTYDVNLGKASLKVKLDDDNYVYSFKLNGEEINPSELEEYDVLTISYDDDADTIWDADHINVIVSRDTAEGKYTGANSAGDEFTFSGTKYKGAYGMGISKKSFSTSTEYTLYLDAFGRIAEYDDIVDLKKIGILKSVYRKNNGDFVAEIINKEAQVVEYSMDEDEAKKISTKFGGKVVEENGSIVSYTSGLGTKTENYAKQVVEYKTSASGKLTINDNYLAAVGSTETNDGAVSDIYKVNSDKIGSIKLSDATTIIDISSGKKDDYKVVSKDSLRDGAEYTVYGYDKKDSVCRFVLLTKGNSGIDSKSQLAIFLESGEDTNADDEEAKTVTLLVNNEQVTLFVDTDETAIENMVAANLKEGDLVVYATNSSDEIDTLYPVFAKFGALNDTEYDTFRDATFGAEKDSVLNAATKAELAKISDGDVDKGDVDVKFGAVLKDGKTAYRLAETINKDGTVNLDDAQSLTIDSNTKIYTYTFDANPKNFGRITYEDAMQVTPDVGNAYGNKGDKSSNIYNLKDDSVVGSVVYAVARTINDDEVQELYLIVAE